MCYLVLSASGSSGSSGGVDGEGISNEPPPVESTGNSRSVQLAAAMFAYLFGPMMLFYGHKIDATIVILNALIASGMSSFIQSVQYMAVVNADVSGGRLMPAQIANLVKVLLSAFTLSVTSLKVPGFNTAVKGAIIAALLSTLILDQVPGQFGCVCSLDEQLYECSAVLHPSLYAVEPRCYWDKWLRYLIRSGVQAASAYAATLAARWVDRANTATVAANLCNEAIFDTVLAVLPTYGARVQPYRMVAFMWFSLTGFITQYVLQKMDDGESVGVVGAPAFRALWVAGKPVMAPLVALNGLAQGLATLGDSSGDGVAGGGGKGKGKGSAPGGVVGRACGCLLAPTVAKATLLLLNSTMLCLALGVLAIGTDLTRVAGDGIVDPGAVYALMAAAAALAVLSLVGCAGAASRRKALLLPYAAALAALIVAEAAGVGIAAQEYKSLSAGAGGSDAGASAQRIARERMEEAWATGNCTADGPAANLTAARPYAITCPGAAGRWLERLVDGACAYPGAAHVGALRDDAAAALGRGEHHLLGLYGQRLASATATEKRVADCLGERNTTLDRAGGVGAFCVCLNVVAGNLKLLRYLAIAAVSLIVFQLVVLLMTLSLMGVSADTVPVVGTLARLGKQASKKILV
eukprot:g296.t1